MPANAALGRTAAETASDSRRASVGPVAAGASAVLATGSPPRSATASLLPTDAASFRLRATSAAPPLVIGFVRGPAGASALVTGDASEVAGACMSAGGAAGFPGGVATGSSDRPPAVVPAAGAFATTGADPVEGSSPASDAEAFLARAVGRSASRLVDTLRSSGVPSATSGAFPAPDSVACSITVSPRAGAASPSVAASGVGTESRVGAPATTSDSARRGSRGSRETDNEGFGATLRAGPAGRSLRSGRADRAMGAGTAVAAGSEWVASPSAFSAADVFSALSRTFGGSRDNAVPVGT